MIFDYVLRSLYVAPLEIHSLRNSSFPRKTMCPASGLANNGRERAAFRLGFVNRLIAVCVLEGKVPVVALSSSTVV